MLHRNAFLDLKWVKPSSRYCCGRSGPKPANSSYLLVLTKCLKSAAGCRTSRIIYILLMFKPAENQSFTGSSELHTLSVAISVGIPGDIQQSGFFLVPDHSSSKFWFLCIFFNLKVSRFLHNILYLWRFWLLFYLYRFWFLFSLWRFWLLNEAPLLVPDVWLRQNFLFDADMLLWLICI